jgi:hypothetical protein
MAAQELFGRNEFREESASLTVAGSQKSFRGWDKEDLCLKVSLSNSLLRLDY